MTTASPSTSRKFANTDEKSATLTRRQTMTGTRRSIRCNNLEINADHETKEGRRQHWDRAARYQLLLHNGSNKRTITIPFKRSASGCVRALSNPTSPSTSPNDLNTSVCLHTVADEPSESWPDSRPNPQFRVQQTRVWVLFLSLLKDTRLMVFQLFFSVSFAWLSFWRWTVLFPVRGVLPPLCIHGLIKAVLHLPEFQKLSVHHWFLLCRRRILCGDRSSVWNVRVSNLQHSLTLY